MRAVTEALTAHRVQLLALCDHADTLLHELNHHTDDAHDRYSSRDEDRVVLDNLDAYTGYQDLVGELHLIHECSDYEAMWRSWQRQGVEQRGLRVVDPN